MHKETTYAYSSSNERVEYWVRDASGAVIGRFNGDALFSARQSAQNAPGYVWEIVYGTLMGRDTILSETEI